MEIAPRISVDEKIRLERQVISGKIPHRLMANADGSQGIDL